MKRGWTKLLMLLSLAAIGLVVYSSLTSKSHIPLKAETIDELLALPDEKIDIGLGAILIGKEYDPELDVRKYLRKLDKMADELRSRIGDETDPKKVIAIMNRYIFAERGYVSVPSPLKKPRKPFLHTDLNQKRASSRLYLALAEKLALPLFALCVPQHRDMFIRYVSQTGNINIDPESNGSSLSDPELLSRHPVPNTPAARAFYMRNLTKREFLGCLFANLGAACLDGGKRQAAVAAYRRALGIVPNYARAWNSLMPAYAGIRQLDKAIEGVQRALTINPNYPEAWFNLALTSYAKGDYRHAWSCIHKCRQLGYTPDPKFIQYLSGKMPDPGGPVR